MIFPTSVERIWRQVEAFRPAANAPSPSPSSEDVMGGAVA
jgi:cyanophycin synthetase